jgi:hypothetical protein
VLPRPIDLEATFVAADGLSGDIVTNHSLLTDPLIRAGTREYRPGDAMRQINWKSTASHNRLMVNIEEHFRRFVFNIVINMQSRDIEKHPEVPSAPYEIERCISVAATLLDRASEDNVPTRVIMNTPYKSIQIDDRRFTNHNRLLWTVEGADGVKTGFTKAAGRILVSSAKRDDRRLVVVTIDDGDDWRDHTALYEEGFSSYHQEQIVTKGDCLGEIPVVNGKEDFVRVLAAEDFSYALAAGEKPYIRLSNKGFVYAPLRQNAQAGFAYVCLGGKVVGRIQVVYESSVVEQEVKKPSLWERLIGGAP